MHQLVLILPILGFSAASPFGWIPIPTLFPPPTTTTIATTAATTTTIATTIAATTATTTTTTEATTTTTSLTSTTTESLETGDLNTADEAALSIINEYRAKHQAPNVTYNTTLRDAAQTCADAYASANQISPPCGAISSVGETNGVSSVGWASLVPFNALNKIAKDEIPYVNYTNPAYNAAAANYTQIIWKSTKQVGCAYSSSAGSSIGYILTCLWLPPGNTDGDYLGNVLAPV